MQRSYTYDIRCETVRRFRDPTVHMQGFFKKLVPAVLPAIT